MYSDGYEREDYSDNVFGVNNMEYGPGGGAIANADDAGKEGIWDDVSTVNHAEVNIVCFYTYYKLCAWSCIRIRTVNV